MSSTKLERELAMSGPPVGPVAPGRFLTFLKSNPTPPSSFEGMTKLGADDGHLLFAPAGDCSRWTIVPLDQLAHVEHIGWAQCGDHSHPLARLTLKSADMSLAATFATLTAAHRDAGLLRLAAGSGLNCAAGQHPCFDVLTGRWVCCDDD
jgi:hypothetical protein